MTSYIRIARHLGKRAFLLLAAVCCASPLAIAGGWQSVGPYGGDAEFVRISRSKPDVAIVGTRRGVLYRLAGDGASWSRVAAPAVPGCWLHALEIHPQNPDSWFAGFDCGEIPANAGLYVTADAGATWSRPAEIAGLGVWSIAFSPSAKRIVAGTTAGVFGDFGDGWKRISPEANIDLKPVVSLAFDPVQEDILFAGTTHLPWRTLDGAKTWTSIHSGMLDDSDVFSISPDGKRKGLVYASACSGVYRSVTGGAQWARLPTPRGAFRAYLVIPDPHRPQVVFAATSLGLLRSTNGGAAWTKLISDIVHSVSFHPNTAGRMYITSTSSGVLVSSDGGNKFQSLNQGFANRQFRSFAGANNLLYVTNSDDSGPSLFRSTDAGVSWKSNAAWPKNLRHVVIANGKSEIAFAASSASVYATSNSGQDWAPLPPVPGGRVLSLAPYADGVLAASASGAYSSTAGSSKWTKLSLPDDVTPQHLYSGADGFVAIGSDKGLLVSTNSGQNWQACTGITDFGAIHSVTGSGGDMGFVLLGTTDGMLRAENGCRDWITVAGSMDHGTVSLVHVNPAQPSSVFAVQHGRVFSSADKGRSWQALSDEGRIGDFPVGVHSSGGPSSKLFALFSRTGVMVQDAATVGAALNFPGGSFTAPAHFNNQDQGGSRE